MSTCGTPWFLRHQTSLWETSQPVQADDLFVSEEAASTQFFFVLFCFFFFFYSVLIRQLWRSISPCLPPPCDHTSDPWRLLLVFLPSKWWSLNKANVSGCRLLLLNQLTKGLTNITNPQFPPPQILINYASGGTMDHVSFHKTTGRFQLRCSTLLKTKH